MAQMFSSGVTPDYLKSLADAYAQYFPQQAPVNTQALQQYYSPNGGYSPDGSAAFAAPMDASAMGTSPSTIVGSLFGQQYPQVHQPGAGGSFAGNPNNPTNPSFGFSMEGLGQAAQTAAQMGLLGPQAKLAASLYGLVSKFGGASPQTGGLSVGGYDAGSQAAAAANAGTVGGYGPGTPGFNGGMSSGGEGRGAATGGQGGDASGGGDRGTRGGW